MGREEAFFTCSEALNWKVLEFVLKTILLAAISLAQLVGHKQKLEFWHATMQPAVRKFTVACENSVFAVHEPYNLLTISRPLSRVPIPAADMGSPLTRTPSWPQGSGVKHTHTF